MSSVLSKTLPDLTKLEQLNGNNFKRWSQKLLMFFEQLEIDYVLFSDPPASVIETHVTSTVQETPHVKSVVKSNEEAVRKFDKDNKTVRCQLLSNMTDTLFDLFMVHKSAKIIWESLGTKYGADDAGKKKYVVVHVYEYLCADVTNEGMKLDDTFIENSDYRNHLKHKKKDLTLQELVGHMKTEEANRLKDKPLSLSMNNSVVAVKANLVESGEKAKGGPGKNQGAAKKNAPGKHTKPVAKIQKPKGNIVCYVCGKSSHKAYQCPEKKIVEANVVVADDVIAAVVVEANLVGNVADWVLDTGASRHLCADKGLFAEFEEVADGDCVYMGNSSSALITGKGKIFLKLTSGKTLALTNVLLVPSLRRNLVSGALLNKAGLKLV
ncbi:hypothetical protein RND81_11G033200 [Saponaria officinalis]|uniref:CCHC-type domain-containing protein n=1 Tax=Saponaria officinalis TaxID=3572 RepID=A0AAW1HHF2_SAPOF